MLQIMGVGLWAGFAVQEKELKAGHSAANIRAQGIPRITEPPLAWQEGI